MQSSVSSGFRGHSDDGWLAVLADCVQELDRKGILRWPQPWRLDQGLDRHTLSMQWAAFRAGSNGDEQAKDFQFFYRVLSLKVPAVSGFPRSASIQRPCSSQLDVCMPTLSLCITTCPLLYLATRPKQNLLHTPLPNQAHPDRPPIRTFP